MTKLALRGWASVEEIVGAFAVIVSLLIVAYSINHNSAVLRSLNDSILYEYDTQAINEVVSDPSMVLILVKLDNSEQLTAIETVQFEYFMYRYLNMWEPAHDQYAGGLFAEEKWHGWSITVADIVTQGPRRLPREAGTQSKCSLVQALLLSSTKTTQKKLRCT